MGNEVSRAGIRERRTVAWSGEKRTVAAAIRVRASAHSTVKVKLHYAYKVRNIGRVCPRLRFCVLC